MFTNPLQSLKILSRIYYGLPGKSAEFKIIWQSVINVLFEDLPGTARTIISTKLANHSITSGEEFIQELSGLTDNVVYETLAVLRLVEEKLSKDLEFSIAKDISTLVNQYLDSKNDQGFVSEFNSFYESLGSVYDNKINRKPIEIRSDISLLYLDFLLRFIVLGYYKINSIVLEDLFVLLNVLFIPLTIFILGYMRSRINRKRLVQLLQKHGDYYDFPVKVYSTASQYTLLSFMTGIGIFIAYSLVTETGAGENLIIFLVLCGIMLTSYYVLFLNNFSYGRMNDRSFLQQRNSWKNKDQLYDPDRNDEEIVETESNLKAILSRLDAYVLESALLGALSFSGFLQIISQNLISFNNLANFGGDLNKLLTYLVFFDLDASTDVITRLMTNQGLFSLVSFETLLCSLFFLMVIAARLRFSNISDKVSYALNMAKAFNQKEEMLYTKIGKEKWNERMGQINKTVGRSLEAANLELNHIRPIHNYIQYFRNAGLLMFFMILISCSLFLSGIISSIFMALALFTILYFTKTPLMHFLVNWKGIITNLVINKKYLFVVISVTFILSGLVLRMVLHIEKSTILVITGLIILCAFLLMDILIIPIFYSAPKEEDDNKKYVKLIGRTFIDWVILISILLLFFGIFGRYQHIPGTSISFVLAYLVMVPAYIYLGFKFYKNKYAGLIIGIILAMNIFYAMARILHFPSTPITEIMIYFVVIIYILLMFKMIQPAFLLRSFTLFYVVMNILLQTGIDSKAITGYKYYTSSLSEIKFLREIEHQTSSINGTINSGSNVGSLKESIMECNNNIDKYISRMGDRIRRIPGFADNIADQYIQAASSASNYSHDTSELETSLSMIKAANRINALYKFNNPWSSGGGIVEGEILTKLGRMEEAIARLKEIHGITTDKNLKINIDNKIAEILSNDLKK